jgi:hypothetical protein
MFTKPVSQIFVILLVLAAIFVTASFISRAVPISAADRSYDGVEQVRFLRSAVTRYDSIELIRMQRAISLSADRSYDGLEQLRIDRSL